MTIPRNFDIQVKRSNTARVLPTGQESSVRSLTMVNLSIRANAPGKTLLTLDALKVFVQQLESRGAAGDTLIHVDDDVRTRLKGTFTEDPLPGAAEPPRPLLDVEA